jgi:hypothetical protein
VAAAVAAVLVAAWFLCPRLLARTAFVLVTSAGPEGRLAALPSLANLARRRYPNAFEALDRASEDPDERVRRTAARLVEQLGQELGRLPLTLTFDQAELDRLKTQMLGDPKARRLAVERVRGLGDPWVYQAGIQLRRDVRGADVETRRRALVALGEMGDSLSGNYVLFACEDVDPGIRCAAATAAGQVRAWRCAQYLANLAACDADGGVRAAAAKSLAVLRAPAQPGPAAGEDQPGDPAQAVFETAKTLYERVVSEAGYCFDHRDAPQHYLPYRDRLQQSLAFFNQLATDIRGGASDDPLTRQHLMTVHYQRALVLCTLGRLDGTRRALEQARKFKGALQGTAMWEPTEEPTFESQLLFLEGEIALAEGRPADARPRFEKSLKIDRLLGDRQGIAKNEERLRLLR